MEREVRRVPKKERMLLPKEQEPMPLLHKESESKSVLEDFYALPARIRKQLETLYDTDIKKKNNLTNTLVYLEKQRLYAQAAEAYLHGDLYNFLGEFAGAVRIAKVNFTLDKQRQTFLINGSDFIANLEQSALLADAQTKPRVDAENTALRLSASLLARHDAQAVVFLSPPRQDDKSVANILLREGEEVVNVLIPYEEPKGSVHVSRRIHRQLSGEEAQLTNALEVLTSPIAFKDNPQSVLREVFTVLGVSQEEQRFSEEFFAETNRILAHCFEEYVKELEACRRERKLSPKAKALLAYMRGVAMEMANKLREKHHLPLLSPPQAGSREVISTSAPVAVYSNLKECVKTASGKEFAFMLMPMATSDCGVYAEVGLGGFAPALGFGAAPTFSAETLLMYGPHLMQEFYKLNPRLHPLYQEETDTHYASYTCSQCGALHKGEMKIKDSDPLEVKIKKAKTYKKTCSCGCDLSCGIEQYIKKWEAQLRGQKTQSQVSLEA